MRLRTLFLATVSPQAMTCGAAFARKYPQYDPTKFYISEGHDFTNWDNTK